MRRLFIASIVMCLVAVVGLAGLTLFVFFGSTPDRARAERATLELTEVDHKVLYDDWNKDISTDNFWRGRRNSTSAAVTQPPSRLQGPPPSNSWFVAPPARNWTTENDRNGARSSSTGRSYSGYRTVCVRACDGYFFPISFSTSEGRFGRDQTTCSNTCPGARLYYYRSSSEDPEDMIDLNGQSYSKLPTANLFRTQYVENCKCKPHPWEQEAVERHRIYALEQQRSKGNKAVVAELNELRTKQQTDAATRQGSRRSQDRNRRRSSTIDDQTSLPVPMSPTSEPAPRSDVTRGQSERSWTSTEVGSPSPAMAQDTAAKSVPLRPVPSTRTASIASNRATVIDAPVVSTPHPAEPSVDVKPAPPVELARASSADTPPSSTQNAIPPVHSVVGVEGVQIGNPPAPTAIVDGSGGADNSEAGPVAAAAPAIPSDTSKPVRRATARGSNQANAAPRRAPGPVAAARPAGMMQVGGPKVASRPPAWRPARDSGWINRVFGM